MKTIKSKPTGLAGKRAKALAEKFCDNPAAIADYLTDAFSSGDAAQIAKAIGDMVHAQGMSRFSRKSGLGRENLYRIFDGTQNPKLGTVIKALKALDIQLKATPSAGLLGLVPKAKK